VITFLFCQKIGVVLFVRDLVQCQGILIGEFLFLSLFIPRWQQALLQ